ncbi:MAG: WG repeat-containing protein [Leptospirales bacterium]|nr:WG repeat-containing protein [Leptospirales bacterium]
MTRLYFSILFVLLSTTVLPAENLTSFEVDGKYGFKNEKGEVRITPRYYFASEFNEYGFTSVAEESGFFFVDQKGTHKFQMFAYDNGPDYFADGLARFVEKGKMGFFNEKAQRVIPAQYDFANPFEKGLSVVCNGCKKVMHGEHWTMEGGRWSVIRKSGKPAVAAEFDAPPTIDGKTVTGKVKGVPRTLKIP